MGRKQKSRRPPPDCGHQNWDGAVPEAGGRRAAQQGPARRDDTLPVPASGTQNCWQVLAACGFLLLAVGLVFGQTVRYQFVNFDDNSYVYENPRFPAG